MRHSSRPKDYTPGQVVAFSLLACCVVTCAPVLPDRVRPAAHPGEPEIVVLRSSNNPLYEQPTRWFIDSVPGQVAVFTLQSGGSGLASAVRDRKPRLIFALGSAAAVFARQEFADVPMVFAMVVDYQRLQIAEQPQVAGIALETPALAEFSQFRMVLPNAKRILAFHSPSARKLAATGKEALSPLGIELHTVEVPSADAVAKSYPTGETFDAIYQMNDPVIFNERVFNFLRDKSHQTRVPLLTSLSDEFAQAGAFASVSVDFTSLGGQAASIAREILAGKTPHELGVQAPIGAYLALNMDVAKKLGVQIPESALPNINKVISSEIDEKRLAQMQVPEEPDAETDGAGDTPTDGGSDKPPGDATSSPNQPTQTASSGPAPTGDGTTKPPADTPNVAKVGEPTLGKPGDAKPVVTAKIDPPAKPKPRTGRKVVFYDPDANHEALVRITSWFTEFLHSVDNQLVLQPVSSVKTYERLAKAGEVDFAILPSSYVRKRRGGNLVPVLVPSAKGAVHYKKVLFTQKAGTALNTIAAAVPGKNATDVVRELNSIGVKATTAMIIPVSKDIDALLALVFGQVDAALVMPESLEVIAPIHPDAEKSLRKLQETKPIMRTPLCVVPEIAGDELQNKVVAAMKKMAANPAGLRAMRTLGFDAWVPFEAGMMRE